MGWGTGATGGGIYARVNVGTLYNWNSIMNHFFLMMIKLKTTNLKTKTKSKTLAM